LVSSSSSKNALTQILRDQAPVTAATAEEDKEQKMIVMRSSAFVSNGRRQRFPGRSRRRLPVIADQKRRKNTVVVASV
jgi:hypothetical protein